MLTPTFHFKILEDFIHVFNEQSVILIDKLDKKVDQECEIFSFVTLCTLDVICGKAIILYIRWKGIIYIRFKHRNGHGA